MRPRSRSEVDPLSEHNNSERRSFLGVRSFLAKAAVAITLGVSSIPAAAVSLEGPHPANISHIGDDYDYSSASLPGLASERPLPPQVYEDFKNALDQDNCATRVELDEVAKVYQQIFGYEQIYEDLSPGHLTTLAQQQVNTIQQIRSEANYATLPEEYQQLRTGVTKADLPLSTYKKSLDKYMDQFGITITYDLDDNNSLRSNLTPIPEGQFEDAYAAKYKRLVVDIIEDTINLPPELVKKSVDEIIIGDVITTTDNGDPAAGFYEQSSRAIGLDVALTDPSKPSDIYSHEGSHGVDAVICGTLLESYEDDAYNALNPPHFLQGEKSVDDLLAHGYTNDNTAALIPKIEHMKDKSIAIAEAYGATNTAEDIGTLGRILFSPATMTDLYAAKNDTTILREKAALLVARIGQDYPSAAKLIIAQMNGARLLNVISKRLNQLASRPPSYIVGTSTVPGEGIVDPKSLQGIQDFQTQKDNLADAMTGIPQYN